jgi:DNA helicase-2/ATP-dependent DNA helicase PcrA
LSEVLGTIADRAASREADRLRDLADLLRWLAEASQRLPAAAVLRELDRRLGYQDCLIKQSGFAGTGAGYAANVAAFLQYAQGKGTLSGLREHLVELDARRSMLDPNDPEVIELRTIHRAKGLEWPVVLVPNCNPGFFPASAAANIEEERRLLYVAITRAKTQLLLYAADGNNAVVSPLLIAAQADTTLHRVAEITAILATDPLHWTAHQALSLLTFPRQYAQERYFSHWWALPADQQQRFAARLLAFAQQLTVQGGLTACSVTESDIAFWRTLAPALPAPDDVPFAGFDALLAPRRNVQHGSLTTPFRVGDTVTHPQFGQGVIRRVDAVVERGKTDWHLIVDFRSTGRKKLLASLAPLRRTSA